MKFKILLLCSLFAGVSAFAAEPSRESIEKLLVVTDVEKLLTSMQGQIETLLKTTMDQAFQGKVLPPEARQFSESFQRKMVVNLKEELSWEKMKALYMRIYVETFTQEEIDGMIAFYVSPAGKALVAKMPAVMQKTMTLTQERMAPMLENMQRSIQDTIREIETMQPRGK